jgi:hypothetical protein
VLLRYIAFNGIFRHVAGLSMRIEAYDDYWRDSKDPSPNDLEPENSSKIDSGGGDEKPPSQSSIITGAPSSAPATVETTLSSTLAKFDLNPPIDRTPTSDSTSRISTASHPRDYVFSSDDFYRPSRNSKLVIKSLSSTDISTVWSVSPSSSSPLRSETSDSRTKLYSFDLHDLTHDTTASVRDMATFMKPLGITYASMCYQVLNDICIASPSSSEAGLAGATAASSSVLKFTCHALSYAVGYITNIVSNLSDGSSQLHSQSSSRLSGCFVFRYFRNITSRDVAQHGRRTFARLSSSFSGQNVYSQLKFSDYNRVEHDNSNYYAQCVLSPFLNRWLDKLLKHHDYRKNKFMTAFSTSAFGTFFEDSSMPDHCVSHDSLRFQINDYVTEEEVDDDEYMYNLYI